VIDGCFVVVQERRQGLGGTLLQHGLDWIREQGVNRVEISVMAGNRDSAEFRSSHEFTPLQLHMVREWN
jgi:GNAT superfamily N-acetyltransferase